MAYDKVIDSAALDAGMAATANAIREKTGQAGAIPWENDKGFSAAVAGIQVGGGSGGGGGNMENGEFVGVQGSLNIPVSSKKTYVMMYPQNVNDENGNAGRISYLFANEGNFQVTLLHDFRAMQCKTGNDVTVKFTETNISFSFWSVGSPCNTIPFYAYRLNSAHYQM